MTRFVAVALFASFLLSCGGDELPRPYNLTGDYVGGAVELRWQCSDEADGFLVQRSDGADYNFRNLGWSEEGQRYYRDETVVPDEVYFYRVAAGYKPNKSMSDFCPEIVVQTK